jgi:uncharacterized membrane protein
MDSLPSTTWGLTLAYWLHMLATVVWIGGLSALVLLVVPAASQSFTQAQLAVLLHNLQRRLDPLAWFSLAVLTVTGMFQMSANPNYNGFLAFNNQWAVAILLKHILFLGMILLAAYQTWWLLPALRRMILRQVHHPVTIQDQDLQRRVFWLSRLNIALAVIVLLLTAIARSS